MCLCISKKTKQVVSASQYKKCAGLRCHLLSLPRCVFPQPGFTSPPLSLQPHAPSRLQPARFAHLQPLSSASLGRYKERGAVLRVSMCAFCVWHRGCTRPACSSSSSGSSTGSSSSGPVSASCLCAHLHTQSIPLLSFFLFLSLQ